MNPYMNKPLAIALFAALATPLIADAEPKSAHRPAMKPADRKPTKVHLPKVEADTATDSGAAGANPFGAAPTLLPNAGTTLTAPAAENANTAADALTVTNIGTGRAISGFINKSTNTVSAVRGTTNGAGGGINGVNSGTTGQAGKFQITNAGSAQTGIISTTVGTGSALIGVNTNDSLFDAAAVMGKHNAASGWGVGVEGQGGWIGVEAFGGDLGLYAFGSVYGVQAASSNGTAVYGLSDSSYGGYFVSNSSYAGYFSGPVYVTGQLTAQSYATASDRNLKQSFEAVDSSQVLDRIAALPIGSWDFKSNPGIHHMGPMAQDFHAAFGLGTDDKHIDVVDGIGVSLVAIQELQRQLKQCDARIEALEAQAAQSVSLAQTIQTMQSQITSLTQSQPLALTDTQR